MAHIRLVQAKKNNQQLPNEVLDLPVEQDQFIATVKLQSMGLNLDKLTNEQLDYINDYSHGT